MSEKSEIQWTDSTWNPVRGCEKVSPGCAHCYAETFAERFRGVKGHPYEQGFDLRLVPEKLTEPLKWRKPRKVFVNSMSDLFQEGVSDEFIDRVFGIMAMTPQHTFQVLTKRADRMLAWALSRDASRIHEAAKAVLGYYHPQRRAVNQWPLPNVWLGVSVENQHFADERIPLLLRTPAAIRFISAEPLLGKVLLDNGETSWLTCTATITSDEYEAMSPEQRRHHDTVTGPCCERWDASGEHFRGIDWVIIGGESGHGARPFAHDWARSIIQQCRTAGVACFMKQLGSHHYPIYNMNDQGVFIGGTTDLSGRRSNGGDMEEWPFDLRVREFPVESAKP